MSTILRRGKEGVIYGITYVDHRTHCVFNGSDLGKHYSAKAILERFHAVQSSKQTPSLVLRKSTGKTETMIPSSDSKRSAHESQKQNIADVIMIPISSSDYLPYPFKQKRKKKSKSHYH